MGKAYRLVCLNARGGAMRMIVTHCESDSQAVRKAAAEAPEDCARLEVSSLNDDKLIWSGTREEALSQFGSS